MPCMCSTCLKHDYDNCEFSSRKEKDKPLVHAPGTKVLCGVGESKDGLITGNTYTIKDINSTYNGRPIEDLYLLEEIPHRWFSADRFRPVASSLTPPPCPHEKCCAAPDNCVFSTVKLAVLPEVAEAVRKEVVEGYPDNNPKSAIGVKKAPLHLVPPSAIIALSRGFANGAAKYGPFNWRENKVATSVYIGALMRHILAYWDGEDVAEDSGELHLDHILSGAAILIDARETGNLIDDRPLPGAASRMLDDYFRRNA